MELKTLKYNHCDETIEEFKKEISVSNIIYLFYKDSECLYPKIGVKIFQLPKQQGLQTSCKVSLGLQPVFNLSKSLFNLLFINYNSTIQSLKNLNLWLR